MHSFLLIIACLGFVLFLLFAFVVAFGAPYLPTLKPQVEEALKLVDLKKGQTLLELGSGDGRVLFAAADKGLVAIGYELNPLLVLYSRIRARKYKGQVKIYWRNFWAVTLPPADGIFVFLLDNYMIKLDTMIVQQTSKPVKLVSFAFKIPEKEPVTESKGLYLYRYAGK